MTFTDKLLINITANHKKGFNLGGINGKDCSLNVLFLNVWRLCYPIVLFIIDETLNNNSTIRHHDLSLGITNESLILELKLF